MKLREIAHARAGDKGDTLSVGVICYDERDFPMLSRELTVDRVRAAYAPIVKGSIRRYELPLIGALNFVLEEALSGGVTTSLSTDPHGKSLSSLMLDIDLPEQDLVHGRRGPAATRRS
jgi:hypothetical protein